MGQFAFHHPEQSILNELTGVYLANTALLFLIFEDKFLT
jgi:hypothetical protein